MDLNTKTQFSVQQNLHPGLLQVFEMNRYVWELKQLVLAHPQSGTEEEQCMCACSLAYCAQLDFVTHTIQNPCLGTGTAHSGPKLHTSVNLIKTIPHRPTLIETLSPEESRLRQVDNESQTSHLAFLSRAFHCVDTTHPADMPSLPSGIFISSDPGCTLVLTTPLNVNQQPACYWSALPVWLANFTEFFVLFSGTSEA